MKILSDGVNSAESRAAAFLVAKGYRIVAPRWRSVVGEVDIVARYVLRFMDVSGSSDAAWMDRLQKAGFVK